MKNVILFTALCLLVFGCKKNSDTVLLIPPSTLCNEKSSIDMVNIKCYDLNPSSAFYKRLVAIISIKKETIRRSVNCATKPSLECKNYISFKNITNKKISYPYLLEYKLKSNYWQYKGDATLERGASSGDERINTDCGDLRSAAIAISLGEVSYK